MDIFSKIAAGEIPSYKCAESDEFYAFLDINPVAKGHTLVIPRHEVDYIFDLSAEEYTAFWNFAHKVATAMKSVMPCKRIGVAVMGLEVPHAHIHLIPINKESDMNFFAGKLTLEDSEMAEIAKKINDEFCKENGK